MNKTAPIIVTLGLIVGIGIILFSGSKSTSDTTTEPVQNVVMRDGVQYVTITAKGGYLPRVSVAEAGVPTKLIVRTNGTYDCSAALVIRSIGFQKILRQTGEEVIDLGTQEAGTLQGVCGMGMYSFKVVFN